MLHREKLKVVCLVVGVTLGLMGTFVMLSPHPRLDGHKTYEKGLFSDSAAAGALAVYGPWMIGIGSLALLGAYLLRDD